MALKKVKGSLERVFDKNLQDLVRGIRNNKENEAKFISSCIDEIKLELRQDSIAIKANAVAKLTYLQLLGYDVSWAAFNVIEVMSSPKFTFKRIGYLAASQSFHEGTDVLMLTTNMIRKELSSQQMYDTAVALNGLSCFLTSDLARDLANDIMGLMASTRPYVRKKAVLLMYKIFLKFPEALRPAFPRLKEKLEDPDPGVQSAAVNVICELARKNPKNYLSLAPLFFKLMTSSTNNWMLIKIIKLFGALTPLEPRLGKKLIEPLTNLIHSTSAMSLLYECINTVIAVLISLSSGIPDHSASIQLCVQKLRILIEDSDQNLKYLGLLAMGKILKTHPKSVQSHKDLILECLDDKDDSIRLRALDLLYGMVSKKNLMEIVKKLMIHVDKAEGSQYRDELLAKIIQICSQNNYQYITNFEWYVAILVELTRIEGTKHGRLIASQMLDVAIRVKAIRPFAVSQMASLLENFHLLSGASMQTNSRCEVLYAAAWIIGEFPGHLVDPYSTLHHMLKQRVSNLPGHIQSVYVQNVLKLYSAIVKKCEEDDDHEKGVEATQLLLDKLPVFSESADLEVQERACTILQLLKYVKKIQEKEVSVGDELAALFVDELNPVAPKAQKKVPVPEGLDLDKWINEPPSESSDDEVTIDTMFIHDANRVNHQTQYYEELSEEELEKRRTARRQEQASNPHYLKFESPRKRKKRLKDLATENVDGIPVAKIDLSVPLHIPGDNKESGLDGIDEAASSQSLLIPGGRGGHRSPYYDIPGNITDKYMHRPAEGKKSKKRGKKGRKKRTVSVSSDDIPIVHTVDIIEEEMPEGATISEDDEELHDVNDPHRALNIDLDAPLDAHEKIPVRRHHVVDGKSKPAEDQDATDGKTKKKTKKDKKAQKKVKKEKKKKRSKSEADEEPKVEVKATEENEENLLGGEPEPVTNGGLEEASPSTTKSTASQPEEPEKSKYDDINFWLTKEDTTKKPEAVEETPETEHAPDEKHKKREKKSKKDKKEKKKDKKKKSNKTEEAEAIANENGGTVVEEVEVQLPQLSSYKPLAENKSIKLTYETRIDMNHSKQVVLSIIFSNLTNSQLKSLDFNVLDSLNTRLVRESGASSHDGISVPFQLPAGATNEGQFAFTVQNVTMPQKLRGTLTYMIKDEAGSTSEKIDFKVHLPVTAYTTAVPCTGTEFANLLSSGDLQAKNSLTIASVPMEFNYALHRVCFFTHCRLVERVGDSASLYSCSIQSHHICLLVKLLANNGLSIEGKGSDSTLLSSFLDDIKAVLLEE
ncbi:AP-3 complex subunit delta-1-like isoform X2 [Anneissia japonica]|uniref:AP-3 complex subunit delta-1-like isoform X2 n=1 Tax=Anneissia japonica TaxID=1529436 RepID=UPI0014257A8B|nr:AP-3 complex subunit delta-1-like isoform X2 [Anneissia japonica]